MKSWLLSRVFDQVQMFAETATHQRCSIKSLFLKISQDSQENTSVGVTFLIKFQPSNLQIYLKRDSDQRVSCDFCEVFKNTFFAEHLRTTASLFGYEPFHGMLSVKSEHGAFQERFLFGRLFSAY